MTYQEFHDLCKSRRSIRYFDENPVSKDDVLKLLDLARMAPSVENLQPWHFHIMFNKEMRKKFMKSACYGNFLEGASVLIIVPQTDPWKTPQKTQCGIPKNWNIPA